MRLSRTLPLAFWAVLVAGLLATSNASAGEWSVQTTPTISAEKSELVGVSCPTATSCTGVGFRVESSKEHPLAEHWNGSSWTVQTTAEGGVYNLSGVSCTSSTNCIAVGEGEKAVAEDWNGTEWTKQTLSASREASLYGVSCSAAAECTAVGGSRTYNVAPPQVFRWNGTEWKAQTFPTPKEANEKEVVLEGVSCTSSTFCMAVGDYLKTGTLGSEVVLSASWNGSAWSLLSAPTPGTTSDDIFDGVSCTSSVACTAVGYGRNTTTEKQIPLIDRWDGTEWSIESGPSELSANLKGAACTSTSDCIAVGETGKGPLALGWNGKEWMTQTLAEDASAASFKGIACSSATACTAVGNTVVLAKHVLVERYE